MSDTYITNNIINNELQVKIVRGIKALIAGHIYESSPYGDKVDHCYHPEHDFIGPVTTCWKADLANYILKMEEEHGAVEALDNPKVATPSVEQSVQNPSEGV